LNALLKKEELNLDDPELQMKLDNLIQNLEDIKLIIDQRKKGVVERASNSNKVASSDKSSKLMSSTSVNNQSSKKLNSKVFIAPKDKIPRLSGKNNSEETPVKVLMTKR
jgi:hypothetical protein